MLKATRWTLIGVVIGSMILFAAFNSRSPTPTNTGLAETAPAGDPSWGSSYFYSPANGSALSYYPSSGCPWSGTSPWAKNLKGSPGVFEMGGALNTVAGSSCTTAWAYGHAWAAVHAGNYTPTSTGIYTLSANVTAYFYGVVYTYCTGTTGSGASQPGYAEVNLTGWIAAWDNNYSTSAALGNGPNLTSAVLFHLDSRDFPCTSHTINVNQTFDKTVVFSSRLVLQSGHVYLFRAGLSMETFSYSKYSGGTSYASDGEFWTQGSSTELNSISLVPG